MVFCHRSSEVLKGPHKLKHCNQHRKVTLSWDKWTKFISFLTPPWTINTCFNGICSFLFFFLCISFHCCHCYYHYYHHNYYSCIIWRVRGYQIWKKKFFFCGFFTQQYKLLPAVAVNLIHLSHYHSSDNYLPSPSPLIMRPVQPTS